MKPKYIWPGPILRMKDANQAINNNNKDENSTEKDNESKVFLFMEICMFYLLNIWYYRLQAHKISILV